MPINATKAEEKARSFRGALTVEAALIMPLILLLLLLGTGIIRAFGGYTLVKRSLENAASKIADYACLYEALRLNELQIGFAPEGAQGVSAEELGETLSGIGLGEQLSDALTDSLGSQLKAINEKSDVLAEALALIFDAVKGEELKAAFAAHTYPLLLNRVGSLVSGILVRSELKDAGLEYRGVTGGISGLNFAGAKLFYADSGHGALIKLKVSYRPDLLGGGLLTVNEISISVTVHAFLGENPFEAELTEEEEDEEKVYRIGNGEHYHKADCYLIDKEIHELSLWEAQEQGYTACKRCKAYESTTVWVTSGGEAYHTPTCSYLFPELTAMTVEEAKELGLEECILCFTENEYFR